MEKPTYASQQLVQESFPKPSKRPVPFSVFALMLRLWTILFSLRLAVYVSAESKRVRDFSNPIIPLTSLLCPRKSSLISVYLHGQNTMPIRISQGVDPFQDQYPSPC